MAATKRRRGAKAAASSSAPAASTNSSATLQDLLEPLKKIASSEERCKAVLQGFCDSKCLLERKKNSPHFDCYYILLATSVINKLLQKRTKDALPWLTTFSGLLSKILMTDPKLLERASHVTASKSILARALLSVGCASVYSLENYNWQTISTLEATIATLDRVIFLRDTFDGQQEDEPLPKCAVHQSPQEQALLNFLSSLESHQKSESPLPPAKRKTRLRKQIASNSISNVDLDAFFPLVENFLSSTLVQRIDGRVALKRWAAMALVWNGPGQVVLLKCVHEIWNDSSLSSTQKHLFMTTLTDIVTEAGTYCGLRSPTGSMDLYIKEVSMTKKSKKKPAKRVDIRDWVVVVIHDLMDSYKAVLAEQSSCCIDDQKIVDTFINLCRAASSSVPNAPYQDQALWTKSLTSLTVALALNLAKDEKLPLDLGFAKYALTYLSKVLKSLVENQQITIVDLESSLSLSKKLPLPDASKIDTNKCTFAGLTQDLVHEFGDEKALSLVIRKLGGNQANLVSLLTSIVQRVYDTNATTATLAEEAEEDAKPKATSSKKRTKSSSTKSKKKRRKVSDEKVKRISLERAMVAAEALQALKWCLVSQKYPKSKFRESIRPTLTKNHYSKLVELGDLLELILFVKRDAIKTWDEDDEDSENGDSDGNSEFQDYETVLFSNHVNMCQVLGRSNLTSNESGGHFMSEPIFGSCQQRLGLYKQLFSIKGKAAHQASLLSNLTSERVPTTRALCSPELYIIKEFTKQVKEMLKDITSLKEIERLAEYSYLDNDIPLSYHDASIVLLAFVRLLKEDQRACLEDLISLVNTSLLEIQSSQAKKAFLQQSSQASEFLARVMVTIGCCLDVVVIGTRIDKFYYSMSTTIRLPTFSSLRDWYRQSRHFMSILNWDRPGPPSGMQVSSLNGFKESGVRDFRASLTICVEVGLESAGSDKCYLLFCGWNGLDNIFQLKNTGSASPRTVQMNFPTLQPGAKQAVTRLLQLKEDVCSLYGSTSSEYARLSPSRLKSNLKAMLHRANGEWQSLQKDLSSEKELSGGVFAILSCLPTYVSASIAAHTKPGNDYFSSFFASAQIRRYHSDDDSDSEGYQEEACETALSRLRECCHALGAAPMHPDWLDVSCSLKDGIRHADAMEAAQDALKLLVSLMKFAITRYQHHAGQAIHEYSSTGKRKKAGDGVENLLINVSEFTTYQSKYPEDRSWQDDIASALDLPAEVVELWLDDESRVDNVEQVRESFLLSTALRQKGNLQKKNRLEGGWDTSIAELRAGGEWELLLADALSACSMDVRYPSSFMDSRKGHSDLILAQKWRTIVHHCTSHMLPAAALLRLGLGKVGRKPHPFCAPENHQDPYDMAPLSFCESISHGPATSRSKTVVSETLSLLSRLSGQGDQVLQGMCHAVATHLVVDTEAFDALEAFQRLRFATMAFGNLIEFSKQNKKELPSLPFLLQRLALVIQDCSSVTAGKEPHRLLTFLSGNSENCQVDTVVETNLEAFTLMARSPLVEDKARWTSQHRHASPIEQFVSLLTPGHDAKPNSETRACLANLLSRVTMLEFASSGLEKSIILSTMVQSFNRVEEKNLKELLCQDLLHEDSGQDLASIFNFLLACKENDGFQGAKFVLSTLMDNVDSWLFHQKRECILETLFLYGCRFDALQDIGSKLVERVASNADIPIVGVDGQAAMEVDEKNDTSDMQVDEKNKSGDDIELLTTLFGYIRDLREGLKSSGQESSTKKAAVAASGRDNKSKQEKSSSALVLDDSNKTLPRSCSYIQKSGFHGQHWYNCYTCGLVWDKGCCTLCALVCHKGHDVSYSRCSSFFCDCGAESNSAVEQNRVACKCLTPMSKEEALVVLHCDGTEKDDTAKIVPSSEHALDTVRQTVVCVASETKSISIQIALSAFHAIAMQAVQNFIDSAKQSPWLDSLFALLRKKFEIWNGENPSLRGLHPLDYLPTDMTKPVLRVSHLHQRKLLRGRRQKPLDLQFLSERGLVPVRSAKGFQAKMSSDTSTNSHLLSKLARHDLSRSILVTDSRGRMIVGEPSLLLFASAIPATTVRYLSIAQASTPLTRQQICLLGSASIRFNIVGMQLCCENENHLVVWGASEACVAVLKPDWSGIEEKIDLVFDLSSDSDVSDYLVKCEWIPGSQTHVAVGCSRFVRIYDMTRCSSSVTSDNKRALPVIGYNLGFEACLRDVTIVPFKGFGDLDMDEDANISKMFLLLENGRLHVVDLKAGANGKLESPGDQQHFEPSECVSLSMGGVRPRAGSSVGHRGSSTRTLGEGSRLAYLKQSRVLLYKCSTSCVLALMLDKKGDVEGTFELIPPTISSEALGQTLSDSAVGGSGAISGPFTHWTELGISYKENGAAYFRVACVGRSLRSNQPKLLLIEFNEREVKTRELSWSSTLSSIGLGFGIFDSFDGLAAFSAPIFHEEQSTRDQHCGERVFLCALASNGSMLFFGDELVDTLPLLNGNKLLESTDNSTRPLTLVKLSNTTLSPSKNPIFPLTIFERLKNIGDSDYVVFGGHGLDDADDLKSRLSRDSGSSLVCPSREGCTITVRLRQHTSTEVTSKPQACRSPGDSKSGDSDDLVIAAIRVLVGGSSNYIPSKIYIQGRPIIITPRLKKWYCLPLTNEEIALGVRNGFVSVGLGPAFDSSSNCVVDSVEVYGVKRSSTESWLPTTYFAREEKSPSIMYPLASSDTTTPVTLEGESDGPTDGLISSARALTFFCELVGSNKFISEGERDFLRQLVQETALERDSQVRECVQTLLERLDSDQRSRRSFHDESVLIGCSKALSNTKVIVDDLSSAMVAMSDEDYDDSSGIELSLRWKAIGLVLRDCLQAASFIARERPMNYLQSMEKLVENNASSASIAVDASKLILEGFRNSAHYEDLVRGSNGIIDLALMEMAIELNTDSPHSKQFASFDVVRGFLESKDSNLVQRCCDSISAFCRRYGSTAEGIASTPDLFMLLQHARLVAYQCDACALFPMKKIRYTLLEGDHDIDLCQECYSLGTNFAEKKKFDAKVEVVINGKSVGAEMKLTCAQMRQMQPVSLEKMDVEQVEVQSTGNRRGTSSDASVDEEEELQKALRMSLGETNNDETDAAIGSQAYEDFVGYLFSSIVDLVAIVLKRDNSAPLLGPLTSLLLELVQISQADSRNDRAKRFAKELSHGISYLLKSNGPSGSQKLSQDKILTLVTCLSAFSNLLTPETDSQPLSSAGSQNEEHSEEHRKPKEKTHPSFVCETHGISAVRRRCAKGAHKDRRFYVCGKSRGERCKYFVWADEVEDAGTSSDTLEIPLVKAPFHDVVQGYFWNHASVSATPLHARLCRLLEEEMFGGETDDTFDAALVLGSTADGKKSGSIPVKSFYSEKDKQRDFLDGVFCSREKLQDVVSGENVAKPTKEGTHKLSVPFRVTGDRSVQLLEASLSLLLLIADHTSEGISRWFSLLCEINVSTSKPANLRILVKNTLKNLCGGKYALYHSVRDHFAFCFQLKRLYRNSARLMEAALVVSEKARMCQTDWATSQKINWSNLGVGDLIGADELISEDRYTDLSSKMIGTVLDELWAVIKNNRGESWRRFCGLRSLPNSQREQHKSGSDPVGRESERNLLAVSPIVALFWIACSLSGSNQWKILRLIDFALTRVKDRKPGESKSNVPAVQREDSNDREEVMALTSEELTVPEEILFSDDRKLNVDSIVAFSISFVYGGKTLDLRKLAYSVVSKLCLKLSPEDQGQVFQRLASSPFDDIGRMGKTSVEFLSLLQSLSSSMKASYPVTEAAELVMGCFEQLMDAVMYDRSNGEWVVLESASGTTTMKKKVDLSCCQYCQKLHEHGGKDATQKTPERRENSRSTATSASQTRGSPSTHRKWNSHQVSPYTRGRLDSSKDASGSNEFCSFFMLKYRLSISDFHLTVNDPRGRYVKTINIYFSPRPVDDVSELKSDDYLQNWQKCATINLPRGASRANASLAQPIVAANLKIEFADFYERPGGSKASDGSLLVHCPRCTRVVTNAHGVCGNCGEVAFQCRKCRHINYDRFDAFLCVECGYCASGSFSFELTSGVASNAIAITNNEDYDRGVKMLGAATSIQNELRDALREKISALGVKKKSGSKKEEADGDFNPALKRAFLGLPPLHNAIGKESKGNLDRVEKAGSVVKFVARPDSSHHSSRGSSTMDRTRSLLRLARQIRSESGSSSDRRRASSDVIIRHLGRGLSIDHMEDENDLLGLLEGGAGSDSPDPLSRVMTRSRRGDSSGQGTEGEVDSGSLHKKRETGKEALAECDKLHMLMREAERESYALNRRVAAWNRLDRGSIAYTGTNATPSGSFTPSHCSSCAVPVAHQLLTLWLRLFQSSPSDMHIDHDFLCTLLEDAPGGKGLSECKRLVVKEIAIKSKVGAKMVLAELRKRLFATRDMTCAEILGQIVSTVDVENFVMADEYSKLATEVLAGQALQS